MENQKKYTNVIVWIIIIIIVLYLISTQYNKIDENFDIIGYPRSFCRSCGYKSRATCGNCQNCGYCVNRQGFGECVPGDNNGPYFRQDCVYYEYNNANPLSVMYPDYIYPYTSLDYVNTYPYYPNYPYRYSSLSRYNRNNNFRPYRYNGNRYNSNRGNRHNSNRNGSRSGGSRSGGRGRN
mgnify:CR=1 FL=1